MKMLRMIRAVVVVAAIGVTAPAIADDDPGAIRHLMMATFDKPEAPLSVDPVTVFKDVAVAGWSQGDMGGRALLRRKHDTWTLTLCSGDALKEAGALEQFGLTAEEGKAMANAVVEAEAKIDPALVAKFSTFDGVVMMDGDGHHPPAQGQEHKS